MRFRFDADTHRYYHGNRELPSVTQILAATGLYKDLSFLNLGPEYRQKGHAVHLACRLVDQDNLDEGKTHPDILPYATAYAEFKKLTGFVSHAWELPMYDLKAGYAGTLDVIGTVPNGEIWLPDLKTGTLPRFVGVQLAAYESLLMNGEVVGERAHYFNEEFFQSQWDGIKRKSLNLDGKTFRLRSHDESINMTLWRSALHIYHARKEANLL